MSVRIPTVMHKMGKIIFHKVDHGKKDFSPVEKVFTDLIEPLCGNQSKTLKKIKAGRDLRCEIMDEDTVQRGLIVYKRNPTSKFKPLGLDNSFKIKTLVLIDPKTNSRMGYSSLLLKRINTLAKKEQASTIHVTIPASQKDSVDFFQKKGFKIIQEQEKKSKKGEVEYFMMKKIEEEQKNATHTSRKRKYESLEPRQSDYQSMESPSKMPKMSPSPTGRPTTQKIGNQYVHELTLKKQYITPIQNGRKTVEGRINSGAVAKFRVGDQIRFFYPQNPADDALCKITKIEEFRSFREMLEKCDFKRCLPDAFSLDQAVSIYNNIPTYLERAEKNGVLALHLEKVRK